MSKEDDVGVEDIFVNFFDIEVQAHANDTSTVVEGTRETGLAPSGERAWAIHNATFRFGKFIGNAISVAAADAFNVLQMGVGKKGMASISEGDVMGRRLKAGILCARGKWFGQTVGAAGEAAAAGDTELVWQPSTPVPFAAKSISLYMGSVTDVTQWRGQYLSVRLEYTYIPATPALYLELAQRWELGEI